MDIYSSKFISIVVCAYNEESTIHEKIKDILIKDKNGEVKEIIIIDDNSSDKTYEIAQNYSKENNKVVVMKNMYKEGKWGALVTGFAHARCEIICITDADVIFQKDTLEKALKLFQDPSVGGVTSNQKIILIRNGYENIPSVSFYEKFRNFFRTIESRIDSTTAFHGQCMFFRKGYFQLTMSDSMADDLDIAIRIRRNGYKTLFSSDSYYIEKMSDLSDKTTRHIFRRRAKAVAQTIIKHRDILFNAKYQKFGLICFPIEFFINIIFPFIIIAVLWVNAIGALLLSIKYKYNFLFIIFVLFLYANRNLVIMTWYQMISVISYIFNSKNSCMRWKTPR